MRAFGCSVISNISRLPAVSSLLCRNFSCSEPRLMVWGMSISSNGVRPHHNSASGGFLTGLSSLISDFPKNISVPTYPKSDLELSPSHPTRGAYHDRHGRGEGCGGRGSVLRAMDGRAGWRKACERLQSELTRDVVADGE